MNRHHLHRILQRQWLTECLKDLRPAVHPRLYSVAHSRQTHQAPIRTKQLAANGASAKLHPPHLPNEQVINGTREIIKATRPGITMRNFAPNDVYSDCSLAVC